jgi:hypothetical protein
MHLVAGKAVRDDAGVIHTAPFDDPQYPDSRHAGIMLQAQLEKGATFDRFVSEDDRGWLLQDGTFLRSGDVEEGPGAFDSTQGHSKIPHAQDEVEYQAGLDKMPKVTLLELRE